jgi:ferritin-like metal-binding protein YciE
MDPDREREHLVRADRHIAETKKHIPRQRVIVENAINKGHRSIEAESMLDALEQSPRIFEKHRQLIVDGLAKAKELAKPK